MKYDNFLQELKLLNPNMYVRVVAGFGDRSGFNSDKYTFSNVKVSTNSDYGLSENEFILEFRPIDSNYSNKVLTVGKLITSLTTGCQSEIVRFTITPESDSDLPCPYFDVWPGIKSQLRIKVISDDLIEIYLDHLL